MPTTKIFCALEVALFYLQFYLRLMNGIIKMFFFKLIADKRSSHVSTETFLCFGEINEVVS